MYKMLQWTVYNVSLGTKSCLWKEEEEHSSTKTNLLQVAVKFVKSNKDNFQFEFLAGFKKYRKSHCND